MSTINWSAELYGTSIELSKHVFCEYHIGDACWHVRKISSNKQGLYLNNNEYYMLQALADSPGIPFVYGYHFEQKHGHMHQKNDEKKHDQNNSVLVREYIQGQPLSCLLKENQLSIQDKTTYLLALASIISMCHKKKIIHGDLKTNNIIVGKHGLFVIDFGAAAWLGTQIDEKLYHSYTRSFSHPDLSAAVGPYQPMLDWYSYLVICYVTLYSTLPNKYSKQSSNQRLFSYMKNVPMEFRSLYYDFSNLSNFNLNFKSSSSLLTKELSNIFDSILV